ncbi:MAG: ornithine cyclodeaminase family protein [Acidimicrobiales bacterium]
MSASVPYLSAEEVRSMVSMGDTIEALRAAFGERRPAPERGVAAFDLGNLLTMPAVAGSNAGVKVITLVPGNPERGLPAIQGLYVLFSAIDGRVRALLDGGCLTALRTPAASGLAADYLAPDAPTTIGIIGAGVQGHGHLEAMRAVRPSLSSVVVASRSSASAEALVDAARSEGLEARVGSIAEASSCEIVCACTSAQQPILPGVLPDGSFLSAIGAYLPDQAEMPPALVAGSDVWVDAEAAARVEAGDLIQAADTGAWSWDQLRGDLVDLVCQGAPASADGRPRIFKSVGLSIEDLTLADLAATRAGIEP